MEEVLPTAHTTYSAAIAVKDLFLLVIIVEKITNFAEIACELDSTFFAILLWSLYMPTLQAFDLFDGMAVHLVVLFRVKLVFVPYFVVAESTVEELETCRAPFLTSTLVVDASIFWIYWFLFFFLLFTTAAIIKVHLIQYLL